VIYDDISYIQQQVTVLSSRPYLTYWHWIASADYCGYDFGGVLINGSVVDVYDLCATENTGGWVKHIVDLSSYAGQLVTLQIRVETDSSDNSNLFVDDVSFQAVATALDGGSAPGDPANALPKTGSSPTAEHEDVIVPQFLLRRR